MNLVEETIEYIELNNIVEEILWVGSRDGKYSMSWNDFVTNFKTVTYDDGFGSQEVAADLVVAFKDGSWLERYEYDGSEGWDYSKAPIKSKTPKPFKFIDVNSARSHTDNYVYAFDGLSSLNQ